MKFDVRFFLSVCLVLVGLYASANVAVAKKVNQRPVIEIIQPWAMPTIGAAKASAAYLTIFNHGTQPVELVGVTTPAAHSTEIHYTEITDDIMRMRRVETLEIPAGQAFDFKPGSYHLMLHGIVTPLKVGDNISMTLEFKQEGVLQVDVPVTGRKPTPPTSSQ